jgi:hypothetical protein
MDAQHERRLKVIGAQLVDVVDVPQRTVANVIERLSSKRDAAKTAKPKR